jgi:hypothetical protein
VRVIRHESGWDIALDMVFIDKKIAETIAERIRYGMHALIRDAVDASMCVHEAANDARGEPLSATARTIAGRCSDAASRNMTAERS